MVNTRLSITNAAVHSTIAATFIYYWVGPLSILIGGWFFSAFIFAFSVFQGRYSVPNVFFGIFLAFLTFASAITYTQGLFDSYVVFSLVGGALAFFYRKFSLTLVSHRLYLLAFVVFTLMGLEFSAGSINSYGTFILLYLGIASVFLKFNVTEFLFSAFFAVYFLINDAAMVGIIFTTISLFVFSTHFIKSFGLDNAAQALIIVVFFSSLLFATYFFGGIDELLHHKLEEGTRVEKALVFFDSLKFTLAGEGYDSLIKNYNFHNSYIQVYVMYGALGLLLLLCFLLRGVVYSANLISKVIVILIALRFTTDSIFPGNQMDFLVYSAVLWRRNETS